MALDNNSVASAGDEVESDQQAKMETSLPIWEAKSEGASELQKEEANPSELGRYKREDKFEFDLMVRIRVLIFQLHFHLYKIMLYNFLKNECLLLFDRLFLLWRIRHLINLWRKLCLKN